MQARKSATPAQLETISSNQPICHSACLHVSLKAGSLKNTCPIVNRVAVRRIGREAPSPMARGAERYRKGFVPTSSASKGMLPTQRPKIH